MNFLSYARPKSVSPVFPMAFDSKGAHWPSAEREIRDPHFGTKMLKCGSINETLWSLERNERATHMGSASYISQEPRTYVRGIIPECKLRLSDFVGTHSIYGLTSAELRR